MKRARKPQKPFMLLAAAFSLSLLLSSCGGGCQACNQALPDAPPSAQVAMRVCLSPIPNPSDEERTCDLLDVTVELEGR